MRLAALRSQVGELSNYMDKQILPPRCLLNFLGQILSMTTAGILLIGSGLSINDEGIWHSQTRWWGISEKRWYDDFWLVGLDGVVINRGEAGERT
jgi:hypothetical protein